jgi:hypothetical protein
MTNRTAALGLCAHRLAPFVAKGLLSYAEAHDCLMGIAIERGSWTPGRLFDVEDWIGRRLEREIQTARPLPR